MRALGEAMRWAALACMLKRAGFTGRMVFGWVDAEADARNRRRARA